MKRCIHPLESGLECGQLSLDGDRCHYHQRMLEGLIRPLHEDLSEEEVEATMHGRPHGDGRRLDQYVSEPR